ncbi:MAG: RNA polymerase sigma factor RpoH [Pseudomonadota bacterium]
MTSKIILANASVPAEVQQYLRQLEAIPMLSAEEERQLSVHYHQTQDPQAAHRLLLPHLRYVVRIAREYQGYGLQLADLIQEGTIGLMKAVKRFDPSFEVRLATFALHWIKAEITDYVLKNWRIVKVATTKAQKKLFFNLRRAKKSLTWLSHAEVEQVANDLGVASSDVREMESRLYGNDVSFDRGDDDEESDFAPADYLIAADKSNPLVALSQQGPASLSALQAALHQLDARSRDILEGRWLTDPKLSLKELAEKYKVSLERIRQIEQKALKTLHGLLAAETSAA